MTEVNQIYRCNVCGNIVEVISAGMGELTCCGQAMELLEARSHDTGEEKHVPVIEKVDDGIKVKVGEVAHPMEDEHYISIIELCVGDDVYRATLEPGNTPEAFFPVCADDAELKAREYCTIHNLWSTE